MTTIRRVAVIVPARNEEQLIGRCLEALRVSRERASEEFGDAVCTSVLVVADACTDETAELARAFDDVDVIEVADGAVGAARRAGIAHAIRSTHVSSRRLWLANTDADSEVAPEWIVDQIRAADSGHDVRVGGVRPRFDDLSDEQIAAWKRLHEGGRAAGHVHGANLGMRASSYLRARGFRDLEEHEDVDIVHRLRATGARFALAPGEDVTTSGRHSGRTRGGYASYLETQLVALASSL